MADSVKVGITERNGTELGYTEEYDLIPANIPFSDAGFTATDVQDAIVEAGSKDIDGGFANSVYLVTQNIDGGGA